MQPFAVVEVYGKCTSAIAHTLTGPLQEIQTACGKDRGETILQSAATRAPAVNKDEVTREDTHPLTVRSETGREASEGFPLILLSKSCSQ